MPLTLESIVVRSQEVMTSPVDDEMVMMALESSRYYGLNRVGRRIWELLEEPTTVAALCAQLVSEFDVAPERCADAEGAACHRQRSAPPDPFRDGRPRVGTVLAWPDPKRRARRRPDCSSRSWAH